MSLPMEECGVSPIPPHGGIRRDKRQDRFITYGFEPGLGRLLSLLMHDDLIVPVLLCLRQKPGF